LSGRLGRGFDRSGSGTGRRDRGFVHALLDGRDSLVLIAPRFGKVGLERAEPVTILFGLAKDIGHLPFERVEPLIERDHSRLGGGGLVREVIRTNDALNAYWASLGAQGTTLV